ncbi:hypothetical protein [Actinoplanes sp. ATCC 53533]|nr:hypothetical protein [Actinoplanes sp. ATCC 53533]
MAGIDSKVLDEAIATSLRELGTAIDDHGEKSIALRPGPKAGVSTEGIR